MTKELSEIEIKKIRQAGAKLDEVSQPYEREYMRKQKKGYYAGPLKIKK